MNSIKTILPGLLLLLLWPTTAGAQEPASTKKQELIKELLVVTDASVNATRMINAFVEEMDKQYPQQVERLVDADPTLTPAERLKAKKILNENHAQSSTRFFARIKERVDMGKVIEDVSSSLYDKYFTEDDLKGLIEFYKTPTGRKTLSVLPQLFAESVQRTGEKLSPILTDILLEMAEEEKERIKRIK